MPILPESMISRAIVTSGVSRSGKETTTWLEEAAPASFTVAVNERRYDKTTNEWVDGDTTFYPCSAWGQMGENVAEALADKGMRVIVQGRLKSRSYETREGEKRTAFEVDVEEVGPSLRYATATVTRTSNGQTRQQRPQADPWAPTRDDQPPF